MTFMVILIALLIERFFDWSHLRRWQWYASWQDTVAQRLSGSSPYLVLAATILPLLACVLILQWVFKGWLYGLMEFLFQLFLFLYCLGPQNLWADTFACVNALVHGDTQAATEKLKASFGISEANTEQSLPGQLLSNLFVAANNRVFASVFWYLILGPIGAVAYRAVTISSASFPQQATAPALLPAARFIESIFDWVPVRLLTCVFALGGHFVNVFSCWRPSSVLQTNVNDKLLTDCGAAALGVENLDQLTDNGTAIKSAIGLLDRTFVIALVMVAVIVMLA